MYIPVMLTLSAKLALSDIDYLNKIYYTRKTYRVTRVASIKSHQKM